MAQAKRDNNQVTTLIATSNVDGVTPVVLWADPTTHRLLVDLPTGSGTVTTVSVVSANGFAGSVATATTTPAITLTTTVTGVLKGNGTAIAAATAGSDYAVGSLGLAGGQTIAGDTLTTGVLTLRGNAADTTTGGVAITTSTASTTKTTGALTVAGGVGVAGTINANALALTTGLPVTSGGTGGTVAAIGLFNNITGLSAAGTTGTTSTNLVFSTSPVLVTPTLGAASATSLATSAASPLLLTNGQLVTIALTSQTVGGTTLTIPDFAGVADEFTFKTKAQTMSNKTFIAPALGTPGSGTLTNCSGLQISGLVASTSAALGVGSIELGHATDTTIARVSSGVVSIEGVNIMTVGAAQTATGQNKFNNIIDVLNSINAVANAATVPVTFRLSRVTNSSAATLTITMTTTSAADGQMTMVEIVDFSAVAQTITWVNTENSSITAPTTSNGSTTSLLTVGFKYNGLTSKWRCIGFA